MTGTRPPLCQTALKTAAAVNIGGGGAEGPQLSAEGETASGMELALSAWSRGRHQLAFSYKFDDLFFSTSYWYEHVDFYDLEDRHGADRMRNLYFHIAAFDINKFASLRPDVLSWGDFADLATPEFSDLWHEILENVWAQWRYENNDPHYKGPYFETASQTASPGRLSVNPGEVDVLAFCGGGKDSLATMKLCERGGVSFDALTYSNTCYGDSGWQHDLCGELLDRADARHRRRLWVFDDFLGSPVLRLSSDSATLTAAETPSSVFAAIPFALQHGYRYFQLGHERSADTGQTTWDATGEEINHQWGKSGDAETLVNDYIQNRLVDGLCYFSILKPVHDVVIFNLLRKDLGSVKYAHSCNMRKPWCCKCPKCAYVWLNYMAWLPAEIVVSAFGDVNLFDVDENQSTFLELAGAGQCLPFECVGSEQESRLAFELCRLKGIGGKAMDAYQALKLPVDPHAVLEKYAAVYPPGAHYPRRVWDAAAPQFAAASDDAKRYWSRFDGGRR